MLQQNCSSLLMIRPRFFRPNQETAGSNVFQEKVSHPGIAETAIEEFDHIVNRLNKSGITIHVFENENQDAPDAVFPNNWVSFHHHSTAIIYPMLAMNRRIERNPDFIRKLADYYSIDSVIDLSHFEEKGMYLEGTGSIVFDHRSKIAYACLSERTHPEVLREVSSVLGYRPFIFSAFINERPVYHTNVMMHVGNKYAVVCFECIPDIKERNDLRRMLAFTGHEVISITSTQLRMFAGNMLEVVNNQGKHYTLMSSSAIRSLHLGEINAIAESSELLSFDLPTIESVGGGSIRCMMAEIFCPVRKTVN